ncbi:hypothetical protein [Oceanobacillus halotolerans]|uniref:hypothetical protein n=1 Tax=Oceanobacillus halotolerans TaxID=2663380 RepID=UPI0013DD0466|nr:hypothetical protein [Oceanobacillus halotolerans]
MKLQHLLIIFSFVTLIGCSDHELKTYNLKGESDHWQGELILEELSLEDTENEKATTFFEFIGNNPVDINSITVHSPVRTLGASGGSVSETFEKLPDDNILESEYINRYFLGLITPNNKISFKITWLDGKTRQSEKIVLYLSE